MNDCQPLDNGVLCTTPQKGTVYDEIHESHIKKTLALVPYSSSDCMIKERHTKCSAIS